MQSVVGAECDGYRVRWMQSVVVPINVRISVEMLDLYQEL